MSWLEIFSRIAPSAADPDIVIVRPWLFRSARALCARSSGGGALLFECSLNFSESPDVCQLFRLRE